jgi:hypothetical protein
VSDYSELLKASSKSAKRKRKVKAAKKQAKRESSGWKPPAGYSAIPKSKKGGYRKMVGGKWDYKYPPVGQQGQQVSAPGDLETAAKVLRDAPKVASKAAKTAASLSQKLAKVSRASGGAVFAALHEVGAWYKAKHHEIEEAIHMAKVASDFSVDPGQAVDLMQTLSQMVMALDLDDDDE